VAQSGIRDLIAVPSGTMLESATLVCAHCGRSFLKRPERTRPREYCALCDHYICDSPACHEHLALARVIDELQNQAERGDGSMPAVLQRFLHLRGQ
jgi:hypothetical protein